VARHLRRAALLYALGLLLALYPSFNFATVRVVGVLPRLAICYLAAALFYRSVYDTTEARRWQLSLAVASGLLVVYWALLRFVPAPGGIAGDLSPSGNLGAWIDRTVIGEAHLWRQSKTWDPEGLLSTLPAIATALTGIAAGVWLRSDRDLRSKTVGLVGVGAASLVGGLLWHLSFPINKNLWTSSYVLLTSGMAAMILGVAHATLDTTSARTHVLLRPLIVLGRNALVLFVLSGWLVKTLIWIKITNADGSQTSLYNWIFQHGFAPLASPKNASLLFALAALLVLYAVLEVLYRRRWFLRA
jgi:predicted acyltransferase